MANLYLLKYLDSFDALDRMALLWKGLFFGSPKKAMTYHFLPRRL